MGVAPPRTWDSRDPDAPGQERVEKARCSRLQAPPAPSAPQFSEPRTMSRQSCSTSGVSPSESLESFGL
jgi:hypothetical protein